MITTSRVLFLLKCQRKTLKYLLKNCSVKFEWRSEGGAVVRAQNPGVGAIYGLSLFLVLSNTAPKAFPPGTPVSLLLKNQHFQIPIRPRTHGHVSTRELINFPIYTWHTYPDGSSSNAKWMGLCPVLLSNRVLYETAFTVTAGKTCYYTERSLQNRLLERHILQAKTLLFLLRNSLTCSFLLRTPLRVNNST